MAKSQINRVLDHLRQAVLDGEDLSDGQLLEYFVSGREEVAFEALVRRHGPMVLSVCRRVVGHAQDAEDAFQATFLVLARKAAAIWPRERVGFWLYGVAYRIALKARAAGLRRQAKEKPMVEAPEPQTPAPEPGSEWLVVLDRELHGLPAKYRVPIVLCDLQGKTQQDAARQLGWRAGTLSGRLSRARALLGQRLSRRGYPVSIATVTTVLSAQAASAGVPAALVGPTAKAAGFLTIHQAVTAGAISASVAALTEGVLTTMMWSKMKAGLICAVALAVVAAGLGRSLSSASGKNETAKNAPAEAGPAHEEPAAKIETLSPQEKDLQAKLKAVGKFDYGDAKLGDVVEHMRKKLGINVVLDRDALSKEGVTIDSPVSVQLADVPLETALRYLLKSINLDYVLQDGIMTITTRARSFTRKVYPIGKLVGDDDAKNGAALIQVITKTVDPDSWNQEGGDGAIDYFPGTKSLVVRQSSEVHRDIAALLRDLAAK
jgi:RNA polymerase sigma factor (sigma-70 family)